MAVNYASRPTDTANDAVAPFMLTEGKPERRGRNPARFGFIWYENSLSCPLLSAKECAKVWPKQRDGQMTHYKSHKVAYFCRQWRANDCVLERGSVLTATTANKMPPFPRPCVGFSICTPTDATHSGFQTSQVFIDAHFLPQMSSPCLFSQKKKI